MKQYRCVKNYYFYVSINNPREISFTKDKIYIPKDIGYEGGGILFVDDNGDDHFIHGDIRKEYFVPINKMKYGK